MQDHFERSARKFLEPKKSGIATAMVVAMRVVGGCPKSFCLCFVLEIRFDVADWVAFMALPGNTMRLTEILEQMGQVAPLVFYPYHRLAAFVLIDPCLYYCKLLGCLVVGSCDTLLCG
jgi:hypothetical protein